MLSNVNCNTVEDDIADILVNHKEGDLIEQERHRKLIHDLKLVKQEVDYEKENEDILSFLLNGDDRLPSASNHQVGDLINQVAQEQQQQPKQPTNDASLDSLSEEDKQILVALLTDSTIVKPENVPQKLEPIVDLINQVDEELANESTEQVLIDDENNNKEEDSSKNKKIKELIHENEEILKALNELENGNKQENRADIIDSLAQIDKDLNEQIKDNEYFDSHQSNNHNHVEHQQPTVTEQNPVPPPPQQQQQMFGVTPRSNVKNADEKTEETHHNDNNEQQQKQVNDPHPYVHIETEKNLEHNQTSAVALLNFIVESLNIPKDSLQNVSVQENQVSFKLHEKAPVNEEFIIKELEEKRNAIHDKVNVDVLSAGVGEQTDPLVKRNLEKKKSKVLFIAIVAICVTISTLVFVLTAIYVVKRRSRMRHNISSDKYEGKSEKYQDKSDEKTQTAQDYQELCRQRMQVKTTGIQQDVPQQSRVTSYNSSDPRQQTESTRSSTSSW